MADDVKLLITIRRRSCSGRQRRDGGQHNPGARPFGPASPLRDASSAPAPRPIGRVRDQRGRGRDRASRPPRRRRRRRRGFADDSGRSRFKQTKFTAWSDRVELNWQALTSGACVLETLDVHLVRADSSSLRRKFSQNYSFLAWFSSHEKLSLQSLLQQHGVHDAYVTRSGHVPRSDVIVGRCDGDSDRCGRL